MDQPSTTGDDDQPKPSLIYDGANWVPPPSSETDSCRVPSYHAAVGYTHSLG